MAKITSTTTIGELALELALLGSPTLTMTGLHVGSRCCCLHHRDEGFVYGTGVDEASACDEAIRALRAKMRARISGDAAGQQRP